MVDIDEDETRDFNNVVGLIFDRMFDNREIIDDNSFQNHYTFNLMFSLSHMDDIIMNNVLNESMDDKSLTRTKDNSFKDSKLIESNGGCECCICMGDINGGDKVFKCEVCKNEMNYDCINEWVKMNTVCPICKNDMSDYVETVDEFEKWIKTKLDI
tara:strand:+ start:368 stop:835 length:468 start_codon:yes stop_codon:yes gene_type:complete